MLLGWRRGSSSKTESVPNCVKIDKTKGSFSLFLGGVSNSLFDDVPTPSHPHRPLYLATVNPRPLQPQILTRSPTMENWRGRCRAIVAPHDRPLERKISSAESTRAHTACRLAVCLHSAESRCRRTVAAVFHPSPTQTTPRHRPRRLDTPALSC
jgi:hypothetical protein